MLSWVENDWIQDLLDLGIGAIAVKYLYMYEHGITKSPVCSYCGFEPKKFAHTCPMCRRELPWIRVEDATEVHI